ncbi:CapA family protein [Flavobacterium sp.]|uniref:CapA family protein n=1 Tax=Flavobacterium sp. TaxID=239 RepID=UPI0025EB8787|nr:CapA family protein [Flavobacterium sp.]
MSYDILVCGDFYVGPHAGGRLEPLVERREYATLFGELYPDLQQSALTIVNLEAPVITSGQPTSKTGPVISMKPIVLGALQNAGVNLVTLANNHIMDYGVAGFEETLTRLEQSDIAFVGAGKTKAVRKQPYIKEIKSKKIAILNVCEHEWITDAKSEAGANGVDVIDHFTQIQELRDSVDFILVIYHGGNEYHPLPTPEMKKIFRFFIDAGASAVVGHHTHTFSGYELYKDRPIFYSLGNFIFDSNKKAKGENWHTGMAVGFTIAEAAMRFEVIPFSQHEATLGLTKLESNRLKKFENTIQHYNAIIANDERLQEEYVGFAQKMGLQYLSFINPYEGKLSSLYKKGLLPSVFSKNKLLLLLNLVRCESHKQLLTIVLQDAIKNKR